MCEGMEDNNNSEVARKVQETPLQEASVSGNGEADNMPKK